MREVGQIIAKHRKEQGISQSDMLTKLASYGIFIKKSAYSSWETGNSQPNTEQFLAICRILNITNIYNEFIGGYNSEDPLAQLNEQGKDKVMDYIQLLLLSGLYQKEEPGIIVPLRNIKLYDLPVSAGPGTFLDSDDYQLIQVGTEVPLKTDFGVRIYGNSMEPQFHDKQIIWIEQTESLLDGEIGIFFLNGNAYCKKFQNNRQGVALISLNPDYQPIPVLASDEFHIFGRVL